MVTGASSTRIFEFASRTVTVPAHSSPSPRIWNAPVGSSRSRTMRAVHDVTVPPGCRAPPCQTPSKGLGTVGTSSPLPLPLLLPLLPLPLLSPSSAGVTPLPAGSVAGGVDCRAFCCDRSLRLCQFS